MTDPSILALKADIVERAGDSPLAAYLRGWARRLGFNVPRRTVELPALRGFDGRDLDALGVRWRRTPDGLVIVRRAGGSR